eukprot:sb/3478462/
MHGFFMLQSWYCPSIWSRAQRHCAVNHLTLFGIKEHVYYTGSRINAQLEAGVATDTCQITWRGNQAVWYYTAIIVVNLFNFSVLSMNILRKKNLNLLTLS